MKNYKEVKNIIYNDMGITKEEILDVFHQIAKEEIQKIVKDNSEFINNCISKTIQLSSNLN